jgi:hypothetical protein
LSCSLVLVNMSHSPMALAYQWCLKMETVEGCSWDWQEQLYLSQWQWEMAQWSLCWVSGPTLHLAYAQEWMHSLLCWHMHVY